MQIDKKDIKTVYMSLGLNEDCSPSEMARKKDTYINMWKYLGFSGNSVAETDSKQSDLLLKQIEI